MKRRGKKRRRTRKGKRKTFRYCFFFVSWEYIR